VFQCLHVLAGALGMVWLARVRGFTWMAATLAGLAYQFFGGFFCNAEHVDIVRGYALLPALLAALTLADERAWRRPAPRFWSIPFFVLCVATGAYPGQVPPVLAAAALYLGAQVLDGERSGWPARAVQAGAYLAMLGLGLLLAAPNLGPAWLLRGEIDRSLGSANADGMHARHLFTTLFGYQHPLLPADISMRSFFVTLPVLVGLFFVAWPALRRQRALVAVMLAAAAMIPAGILYGLVVRLAPPFGYSRFPIADYRALLAVPAILLGVLGLERLVRPEEPLRWSYAFRGTALLAFLAAAAGSLGWRALPRAQVRDLALLLGALAVLLAVARLRKLPASGRLAVLALVGLVMVLDGGRMHSLVTITWKAPPGARSFEAARRELQASVRAERTARPGRVTGGFVFTRRGLPNLDGYLHGRFVADDFAVSEHLRAVMAARADPAIASYLYAPAQPRLVMDGPGLAATQVASSGGAPAAGAVVPHRFAAERVSYDVNAPGERILVENEPAFAGWRGFARCEDPAGQVELRPVPELWPLRAWRVPPGQYRFCAAYRLPGLRACLVLAGLALLAWLGAAALYGWLRRRPGRAAVEPPGAS